MPFRHRQHRVALVPLDSRPWSAELPRLLGNMVDYEVLLPPEGSLGRFTAQGHCEEISAWLRGVVGEVDCAVISIDMLALGGLEPSCTTQTSLDAALSRIEALEGLRQDHPDVAIFCFNATTRATIPAWMDRTGSDAERILRYGELRDRVHRLGEDGLDEELQALEAEIPSHILSDFLAARERNHQINRRAIALAATGTIDFLVLGQDEATEFGFHRGERAELAKLVADENARERVLMCSGIEEMGMTLLARFINTHMLRVPTVAVVYSSDESADRIAPGDDRPLRDTVREHIAAVGGQEAVGPAGADLVLFVNTPPADARDALMQDEAVYLQHCSDLEEFVEAIDSQMASERATAVCDAAFSDGADPVLIALLLEHIPIHRLAAYAGWRHAPNSVGAALAHATTRLVALQDRGAFNLAYSLGQFNALRYLSLLDSLIDSERTHVEFLFSRFVEDWAYQTKIRRMATEHVTWEIQASALDLADTAREAADFVRMHLSQAAHELYLNHFLGRWTAQIVSGEQPAHLMLCELEELHIRLPWGRLSEVELGFRFGVQVVDDEPPQPPAQLAGEQAVS